MFSSNSVSSSSGQSGGGTGGSVATGIDINEIAFRLNGDSAFGTSNSIFIDSSDVNASLTKNGYVTQGPVSPNSPTGFSVSLDGSADYLTSPNNNSFNFDLNDYCIDFWIFPTNWGSNGCGIVGHKTSDATSGWVIYNNTSIGPGGKIVVRNAGGDFVSTSAVDNNKWQHWRLSRKGSSVRWFKNGKIDAVISTGAFLTSAITDATALLTIGHTQTWSGNAKFAGRISNIHIQKGIGYDTEFSVPTESPVANQYTVFLGLCDNRFIDRSINNIPYTIVGYPEISQDGPFEAVYDPAVHGGSLHFNGTNGYIDLPNISQLKDLDAAGNWAIDFWFKPLSKGALQTLMEINRNSASNKELEIRLDASNNIAVLRTTSGLGTSTSSLAFTGWFQWNHLAVVKTSNGFNVYLNGNLILQNTSTVLANIVYYKSTIGCSAGSAQFFKGYISGLRIQKGTHSYTGNFTPSVLPPVKTATTVLLLKATNANVLDLSYKTNLHVVGNFRTDPNIVKSGINSIFVNGGYAFASPSGSFSGTSDRISQMALGNGDFSAEAWVYATAFATNKIILSTYPNTTLNSSYFAIYIAGNGELTIRVASSSYGTAYILKQREWTHVAITRSSLVAYVYVNGEMVYTVSHPSVLTIRNLTIGANADGTEVSDGYLDNILVMTRNRFTNSLIATSQTVKNPGSTSSDDTQYKYNILSLDINTPQTKDVIDLADPGNTYTINKELASVAFSKYSPFSKGGKSFMFVGDQAAATNCYLQCENGVFGYYGKKTTIELFVFPTNIPSTNSYRTAVINNVPSLGNGPRDVMILLSTTGSTRKFTVGVYSGGPSTIVYSTITGTIGEWNHIVVQVDCIVPSTTNTVQIGINGVKETLTHNFSTNFAGVSNDTLKIGNNPSNGPVSNRFRGNISNLRVVQSDSTFVYEGAITVPTSPLTVIPGTVLLTAKNGYLIDESPNRIKILGINGSNDVSTSNFSPFDVNETYNASTHRGSALFFSTDFKNNLSGINSVTKNFSFGTGDFTIDIAASWTALVSGNERILTLSTVDGKEIVIGRASTGYIYFTWLGTGYNYQTALTPGHWFNLSIIRTSGVVRVYVNGIDIGGFNDSTNLSFNNYRIGKKSDNTERSKVHLSYIHVATKSFNTGNFTPDIARSYLIPESVILFDFTRTSTFEDSTGNFTIVPITNDVNDNNQPTSTSDSSISGVNSLSVNSTYNQCLALSPNQFIDIANRDFVIEFNYKKTGTTTGTLFRTGTTAHYAFISVSDNTNNLSINMSSNGTSWDMALNQTFMAMTVGSTYNIVIRKTGARINVFVNGTYRGGINYGTVTAITKTNIPYTIGGKSDGEAIPGTINNFRFTLGRNRYIANDLNV